VTFCSSRPERRLG